MCVCVLSHAQLFVTSWTVILLSSSIHGIFQAGILEWMAISKGSSQPRDQTNISCVSCIERQILIHCNIREVSLWVLLNANPEIRTWMQATYLGGNSRMDKAG